MWLFLAGAGVGFLIGVFGGLLLAALANDDDAEDRDESPPRQIRYAGQHPIVPDVHDYPLSNDKLELTVRGIVRDEFGSARQHHRKPT